MASHTPPTSWLTADEVVLYLGLPSRGALYQMIRRAQIPAHRLGARRLRFRRDEIDAAMGRPVNLLPGS